MAIFPKNPMNPKNSASVLWNHLLEEGASDALLPPNRNPAPGRSTAIGHRSQVQVELTVPDGDQDGIQHTVSEVGGMVDARVGSMGVPLAMGAVASVRCAR